MDKKAIEILIETVVQLVRENELQDALDLMVKDVAPIKLSLSNRINAAYQRYSKATQDELLLGEDKFTTEMLKIGNALAKITPDIKPTLERQTKLEKYHSLYTTNMDFEKIIGETNELLPINWIYKALEVSKSVCQIRKKNGDLGTGWLLEDGWILTNAHVIKNKEEIDGATANFDFEKDLNGNDKTTFSYTMQEEGALFSSKYNLDYAYIKLINDPAHPLSKWGHLTLNKTDIPSENDRVSIIQHPKGEQKQVALHSNQVIAVDGHKLFYTTDTEKGSSGAPVFNSNWQVVALHHAGKVENGGLVINNDTGERQPANRGILIGAIKDDITKKQNKEPNT